MRQGALVHCLVSIVASCGGRGVEGVGAVAQQSPWGDHQGMRAKRGTQRGTARGQQRLTATLLLLLLGPPSLFPHPH